MRDFFTSWLNEVCIWEKFNCNIVACRKDCLIQNVLDASIHITPDIIIWYTYRMTHKCIHVSLGRSCVPTALHDKHYASLLPWVLPICWIAHDFIWYSTQRKCILGGLHDYVVIGLFGCVPTASIAGRKWNWRRLLIRFPWVLPCITLIILNVHTQIRNKYR